MHSADNDLTCSRKSSQGDADEIGMGSASPKGEDRRQVYLKGKGEASAADGMAGMPGLHAREDSDDLNLARLASLTASRPQPTPAQVLAVNNEEWLGKLKELSRTCKSNEFAHLIFCSSLVACFAQVLRRSALSPSAKSTPCS